MKICILGLDDAAPDVIFGDEHLTNVRRLMDLGLFGRLESVVPPTGVPTWMCLSTSQDPGSLGLYGLRNRADYKRSPLDNADADAEAEKIIHDRLAGLGYV